MANIHEITHTLIQQRGEVKAAIVTIDSDRIGVHVKHTAKGVETWLGCLALMKGRKFTGTIWFKSGSYAYLDKDSGGYCWHYVAVPEIPEELKKYHVWGICRYF